jgi:hypothetical protein
MQGSGHGLISGAIQEVPENTEENNETPQSGILPNTSQKHCRLIQLAEYLWFCKNKMPHGIFKWNLMYGDPVSGRRKIVNEFYLPSQCTASCVGVPTTHWPMSVNRTLGKLIQYCFSA